MMADGQAGARAESRRWPLSRGLAVIGMDRLGAQAVRFVITGVVVSIVYIAVTTVLAEVSHLLFQVALLIGWCTGISVHFTLQRTFVWARQERFALPFGSQIRRYLPMVVGQLVLTAASTAVLPSALGLPVEAVYLATAVALTSVNFLVFRNGIFHADAADAGS